MDKSMDIHIHGMLGCTTR